MCSLRQLPMAKNHNFGQILTFWGLLYQPPFTDYSQIWCATADPRRTLTCQILSRSVYSVALWRRKTPIFAGFWTSAFSGVAIWQQSEKVEHGCTTTNLRISNGIIIVSVLQRLHGEIKRIISDVQKRDEQIDRQTDRQKKLNVFGGCWPSCSFWCILLSVCTFWLAFDHSCLVNFLFINSYIPATYTWTLSYHRLLSCHPHNTHQAEDANLHSTSVQRMQLHQFISIKCVALVLLSDNSNGTTTTSFILNRRTL